MIQIINDNVITKLIRYFGLSKNCWKIIILSVIMITGELGRKKERNPLQEGMLRTSGPQCVYNPIGGRGTKG